MMDVEAEAHLFVASLLVFLLAIILTVAQRVTISSRVPLPYQLGWKSPKKEMKKEKRMYLRHKTLLRTKYKADAKQGISWISDINMGGLRLFLADKIFTIGTPLQVEIDLPHPQKPISAQGNIVWIKEGEAGLNFSEVKQGDVNQVIQYAGEKEQL